MKYSHDILTIMNNEGSTMSMDEATEVLRMCKLRLVFFMVNCAQDQSLFYSFLDDLDRIAQSPRDY